MRALFALPALLAMAACSGPEQPAAPASEEAPITQPATSDASPLDAGALTERKNPTRLLAYLSAAVAQGKWDEAARAWHEGMDAAKLKAELGGLATPRLHFGTGTTEGAAGSLYYETSIEIAAEGAFPGRYGTITLRRVNDVPGAEDWQLDWHVERIDWQDGDRADAS